MTYEYKCDDCGIAWEEDGKKPSDSESPCPACSKPGKRIISKTADRQWKKR